MEIRDRMSTGHPSPPGPCASDVATRAPHGRALAGIALAGLLAHGLLPWTDHVVWDGWICLKSFTRPEGCDAMWRLYREAGRPLDWLLYRGLFLLPNPVVAAKVVGLLLWVACAMCQYLVLVRAARLAAPFAFAIAALAVALPCFDVLGDVTFWTHGLALGFFWIAWLLLGRAATEADAPLPRARRVAAWLLLAVSFNLNSLLVFFPAWWLVLLLLRHRDQAPANLAAEVIRVGRRLPGFVVLPLLFWLAKLGFTPTSGSYADYNRVHADLAELLSNGGRVVSGFLMPELDRALRVPGAGWIAGAVLLGVLVVGAVHRRKRASFGLEALPSCPAITGLGLILLVAAALPYLLVGQELVSAGWSSRNCILTPLPIALLGLGAAVGLQRHLLPKVRWLWQALAAAAFALAACASHASHLEWQALGAKQLSIVAALRRSIGEDPPTLVQLRDYFVIPRTILHYPPLILTFMATPDGMAPRTLVFDTIPVSDHEELVGPNGEVQIVFPEVPVHHGDIGEILRATTMPYALQSIPHDGDQLLFVVSPGDCGVDGIAIGLGYLRRKWFEPATVDGWLGRLSRTLTSELPPIGSP